MPSMSPVLDADLAPRDRPIAPRMALALHAHSLKFEDGWARLTPQRRAVQEQLEAEGLTTHFRASWIAAFSW